MKQRLKLTPVRGHSDIRRFFDRFAPSYAEQHGSPERLLRRRLGIIRNNACFLPDQTVLEIGCGDGRHLIALAGEFARGIGIDLSPSMIEHAHQRLGDAPAAIHLVFQTDLAETLDTIPTASVDVAFCVGALEHMIDHAAVLRSAFRVLRPGGRFVCLTPNGNFVWYTRLAPALGMETRRLSTDRYFSHEHLRRLLTDAGFRNLSFGYWTFVPRGDLDGWLAVGLHLLDWIGRLARMPTLRGGLVVRAERPADPMP